jgi:hypothetical protein
VKRCNLAEMKSNEERQGGRYTVSRWLVCSRWDKPTDSLTYGAAFAVPSEGVGQSCTDIQDRKEWVSMEYGTT